MSTLSILAGMAPDQARLRGRLEALSRQVSTGQLGQTHGALGAEARRAVDLRGEATRREAYIGAADTALGRTEVAQGVLARLESLASNAAAEAARARTLGAAGVDALAAGARAAFEEAVALLNTQAGGEYLFAGADLAAAPVPDPAPLAGAVAAAVGTLTPLNAAAVLAATAAAATAPATRPFNAYLEGPALADPRRAVQVGDGERVAWGVLASQEAGGEVALSWGREMLRGLATLSALTPASAAQDAGYDALLAGVAGSLTGATRGLATERGTLGAAERRVEAARERHADLLVTLRAQVGAIEEVDLAAASAALRQTEVRLEASYNVTASLARLSLAAMLR